MEIGTGYNSYIPSLLGSTTGASSQTGSSGTSFGPPAQVSIGDDVPSFTGLTDYVQLGLSGTWQFDLSTAIGGASASIPKQTVSKEEAKREDELVQQAFTLVDETSYDEARQLMQDLLDKNPTNAAAVHALGYAEMSAGNYAEAERQFLRAHALDPQTGYDRDAGNARTLQKDDQTVYQQARAMVATSERRDDGIRLLIELTKRSPEHTAGHMLLGDQLVANEDPINGLLQYQTAIRKADAGELKGIRDRLESLAEKAPNSAFVRQLLGRTQMRQGQYGEAVQTLRVAVELSNNQPTYQDDLAAAYVGQGHERLDGGDVAGAVGLFEQAKDLNPVGRDVKNALAEGYTARAKQLTNYRDFDGAAADYQRVANLIVGSSDENLAAVAARGAYLLGRAIQSRREAEGTDVDQEVTAYKAAYAMDRDNSTYRRKLAEANAALGDQHAADEEYQEAAAAYLQAHNLYEHDKTYKQKTIDAYVAWGDERKYNYNFDTAIKAYRAAFDVDSTNSTVRQKLADGYVARGLDFMDEQDNHSAVADFREALRLFPGNATYQAYYDSVKAWDY